MTRAHPIIATAGHRAAILLAMVGVMAPQSGFCQEPAPVMDKVRSDWKRRQEAIHSLRVTWEEQESWQRGYISDLTRDKTRLLPPSDITFTKVNNSLTLSDDRVRVAMESRGFDPAGLLKEGSSVEIYGLDGRVTKLFHPAGHDYPMGLIQEQRRFDSAGVPCIRAILMTARPLSQSLRCYDIDRLEPTGRSTVINGARCLELAERVPVAGRRPTSFVWVDPTRGHVIVRYSSFKNGKLSFQMDVGFQKSEIQEWLPSSWNTKDLKTDGSVALAYRGKCSVASINSDIDDNEFRLEFPPGTRVHDYSSGGHEEFIRRADGSKRVVGPQDHDRSYDEILSSRGGYESVFRRDTLIGFAVRFLALSVVLVIGYRLFRRYTRRAS